MAPQGVPPDQPKDLRDLPRLLATSAVTIDLPVQWGEMDALGHVNNVVYFRYLESARVAFIRSLGLQQLRAEPIEIDGRMARVGFILQSVTARFRRPLFYPDMVRVTSRIVTIDSDRFTLEHEVMSTQQQVVAALGEGTIVMYDYDAKEKVNMPRVIEEALRR